MPVVLPIATEGDAGRGASVDTGGGSGAPRGEPRGLARRLGRPPGPFGSGPPDQFDDDQPDDPDADPDRGTVVVGAVVVGGGAVVVGRSAALMSIDSFPSCTVTGYVGRPLPSAG
jgi:hypothetical protein